MLCQLPSVPVILDLYCVLLNDFFTVIWEFYWEDFSSLFLWLFWFFSGFQASALPSAGRGGMEAGGKKELVSFIRTRLESLPFSQWSFSVFP